MSINGSDTQARRKMNFQKSLDFMKIRVAKFNLAIKQELHDLGEELDGYDDIFNNRDLWVPLMVDRFDDAKEEFVQHMYDLIDIIEAFYRMMEKFDLIASKIRGPGTTSPLANELSLGLLKNTLNQLPPKPDVRQTDVKKVQQIYSKPSESQPEVGGEKMKSEIRTKCADSQATKAGNNQGMVAELVAKMAAKGLNTVDRQQSVPEIGISPVNGFTKKIKETEEPVPKPEVKPIEIGKVNKIEIPPKPAPRKVNANTKMNINSNLNIDNQNGTLSAEKLPKTTRAGPLVENAEFYNGRKLVFDSEEKTPTMNRRSSHKYHQALEEDIDSSDRWLNSLRKYKKISTKQGMNSLKRLTSMPEHLDENNNNLTEAEKDEISQHLDIDKHNWEFKEVVTAADMIEFIKKQKLVDNQL